MIGRPNLAKIKECDIFKYQDPMYIGQYVSQKDLLLPPLKEKCADTRSGGKTAHVGHYFGD